MNTQELTSYLDELLFSKTGEHLDSLQRSIIRGVLNGKKYADIAKEYNCSAGHAKGASQYCHKYKCLETKNVS
jgi:hypothetical protein